MSADSSDEDELLIIPVPALVAVLLNLRATKGQELTQEEVLTCRDKAECIAMPRYAAEEVILARGYDDIDPENVWEEWSSFVKQYDSELGEAGAL
ncbi:MAG TPA: hypothetical protein VN029_07980 [Sphingomonas sp.]|nr:hypothetical protein [Sphingomonas sp.]